MKKITRRVACGVLVLCVAVSGSVLAASDKDGKKNTEPCPKLPAVIELDAGKHKLTRRDDGRWTYKTELPRPSEFYYNDADDGRRVYRFRLWTGDQYSCFDTGRFAM
jgi:hypothetical protein